MNTKKLIESKSNDYGTPEKNFIATKAIKDVFFDQFQGKGIKTKTDAAMLDESLDGIFRKLGRVCTGSCLMAEHWEDIAGYAQIMANYSAKIKKEEDVADIT